MSNLDTPQPSGPCSPAIINGRYDRLILVFDGDSGIAAMLMDVAKKAVGKEECPLCEIIYSPVGKRGKWRTCETRLGLAIEERHRDRLPAEWNLSPTDLPCILGRVGDALPSRLVTRQEIIACRGNAAALEQMILKAIAR